MTAVLRIKKRADFLTVGKEGVKIKTPSFCLCALSKFVSNLSEPAVCRVGYTASRKVGNAVIRNRSKRRLRALVDLQLKDYIKSDQCIDIVLIAYKGLADRPFDNLKTDFNNALSYLSRKLKNKSK